MANLSPHANASLRPGLGLSSDMRDGGLTLYQLYLLGFLSFLLSEFLLMS